MRRGHGAGGPSNALQTLANLFAGTGSAAPPTEDVELWWGTVASISGTGGATTVSVNIGGSATASPGVAVAARYIPTVGDVTLLLAAGPMYLALGPVGTPAPSAPTLPGTVNSFSIPIDPTRGNGFIVSWLAATNAQAPLYAFFDLDNSAHYHYTYEEIADGGTAITYGENETANGGGSFRISLCTAAGNPGSAGRLIVPILAGVGGLSLSGTADSSMGLTTPNRYRTLTAWQWSGAGPITSVGFLLGSGAKFTANSQFAVTYT